MMPRRLRAVPLTAVILAASLGAGCTKEEPKAIKDEPKKTTPVPDDMGSFNDFLPKSGGAGGLAVKLDGGLEGGLAAVGGGSADAQGEPGPGAGEDEKPGLKVTDPGGEPRAVRKYTFTANRVDKRNLTIAQEQSRGGQIGNAITLQINVDFTPKKVDAKGAHFEAKVTKVDLPGAQAGAQQAQLAQALSGMNGLTGTFDLSPRGEAGEVAFQADAKMQNPLADGVVQGLQQAIELITPPFPDAPIGVGAKWERSQEKKEGGVEQKAKQAFTLKELTAEGGVVEADIELKVPKRAIQAKGLPPGATIAVDGKGHYTYQFRFDHLATKVTGEIAVTQHIEVADQTGKKQTVDENQKVKQTIETPPGK